MAGKSMTAKQMRSIIHFLVIVNIVLIIGIVVIAILYAKQLNSKDDNSRQAFTYTKANGDYIVCIDAGHGGSDVGAEGLDGSYEKDDNLELALLVEKNLKKSGVKTIMTRTDDSTTDLSYRSKLANDADADLFVSLHRNSTASSKKVKGVEIWIHSSGSDRSYAIADNILSALEDVGVSKNRGVRIGTIDGSDSNYAVIRETEMTSLILEMGFMTNKEDQRLFDDNIEEYANAISNAIVDWLNQY